MCCRLQHFYRYVTLTMPSFPDAFGRVGRASIVYRPLSPAPCTPWLVEQCSIATRHTHAHTHSSLEYKLYFYACVHIQCNRSTANNSDVVTQDCRRPRREAKQSAVIGSPSSAVQGCFAGRKAKTDAGAGFFPPPLLGSSGRRAGRDEQEAEIRRAHSNAERVS